MGLLLIFYAKAKGSVVQATRAREIFSTRHEAQKAETARVARTPTLSYRTPSHDAAADARFVFVLISMLRLTTVRRLSREISERRVENVEKSRKP